MVEKSRPPTKHMTLEQQIAASKSEAMEELLCLLADASECVAELSDQQTHETFCSQAYDTLIACGARDAKGFTKEMFLTMNRGIYREIQDELADHAAGLHEGLSNELVENGVDSLMRAMGLTEEQIQLSKKLESQESAGIF